MKDKLRLAMLVSGGGTTMQAIIESCQSGSLSRIEPVLVIASRPDAGAIQKALNLGIPRQDIIVIEKKSFPNAEDFGEAILRETKKRKVDLIGQYGWMVKTPANVIEEYWVMMINQHPGPLDPGRPDFGGKGMYGLRVHASVLYFARETKRLTSTEATAQQVAIEYDKGTILRKEEMPITKNDDPYSLAKRLLPIEHKVQIETLRDFANSKKIVTIRVEPLILPEEIEILEEAKKVAKTLFPKG